MTNLTITLGSWNRKRRNAAGKLVRQKRHTINQNCRETGGLSALFNGLFYFGRADLLAFC